MVEKRSFIRAIRVIRGSSLIDFRHTVPEPSATQAHAGRLRDFPLAAGFDFQ